METAWCDVIQEHWFSPKSDAYSSSTALLRVISVKLGPVTASHFGNIIRKFYCKLSENFIVSAIDFVL